MRKVFLLFLSLTMITASLAWAESPDGDSISDAQADPAIGESAAEAENSTDIEVEAEVEPEAESEGETEAEPVTEAESEPEVEFETETYTEPEIVIETETAREMKMSINGTPVTVSWEDNESVSALRQLADGGLTIQMSMYGSFEQVGSIGQRLPSQDAQTTTSSGDIVLYSGNQLVVFYGTNSWAYTRLGSITGKTPEEITSLLGYEDATITLSLD